MSSAPVVFFVYNRLAHTRKTIEALKKNTLAQETDLFIYSDCFKADASAEVVSKVKSVREYIRTVGGFKSVTITEAEKNKGLAKSVIEGVTNVINKYGRVIVIEDDLITSKYFLQFMNDALLHYENDNKIWSISGYTPPLNFKDYERDIYTVKRGCSWGWATWKNRWDTINWSNEFYKSTLLNNEMKKRFNETGADMSYMLELQSEGRIDSWAIRWCYNQFLKEKYTVYPVKSFVQNTGTDNSGTHSGNTKKYTITLNTEYDINFENDIKEDKRVLKEFRKFYSPKLKIFISKYSRKLRIYKQLRRIIYK